VVGVIGNTVIRARQTWKNLHPGRYFHLSTHGMGNADADVVYYPLRGEVLAVGIVGVTLYGLILCYALCYYRRRRLKHDLTMKYFFLSTLFCVALELPRYVMLIVDESYSSRAAYSLHLVSNIPLFVSFSCVILQWSRVLVLSPLARNALYSLPALVASNALFSILDFLAAAFCAEATSLDAFFESSIFEWFTFLDALRNLLYSSVLAYFGLKVLCKLHHYRTTAITTWSVEASLPPTPSSPSSSLAPTALLWAILRLTLLLTVISLCFLVRIAMLCIKLACLHDVIADVTTPGFSLFGLMWFTLADFIPRTVPVFCFLLLMSAKAPDEEGAAQLVVLSRGISVDEDALAAFDEDTQRLQCLSVHSDDSQYYRILSGHP